MLRVRVPREGLSLAYNLKLLAEAGKILSSSLDYNVTLSSIVHLLTSTIADLCYIDLLREDKTLKRVAVIDSNKKMRKIVKEQYKYPPTPTAKKGAYSVVRSGKSLLISPVTDAWLRSVSNNEQDFKNMKQLGYRSIIFVPLFARGKTIGVLSLASRKRLYDSKSLKLAEELGRRAAVAVDNAQLYKTAREAIKVRDEFLSIASHEFKTPLTSILLHLQTLLSMFSSENVSSEKVKKAYKMLQSTEHQTRKLSRLIKDLLDISLISTGKMNLKLEYIDLVSIVKDVLSYYSVHQEGKKYNISLEVEDSPLIGLWDSVRVDQVVSNLVSNAVKYGKGRPINITLKRKNSKAVFIISDKGIGIKKEYIPYIFNRFARAVHGKEVKGLGVGLYVIHQIILAHKGKIKVVSQEGKGSTFTLELSLRNESAEIQDGLQ